MCNMFERTVSVLFWLPCSLTEVLIFVIVALLLIKYIHRPKNLPPGPWSWPILGTIPSTGDPPHIFLSKLSKRYGSVYTLFMGSQRAVVLNDFASIRETFVNRGDACNDRPDMEMFKYMSDKKGLFAGNGELWRFQRRLSSSVLHQLGTGQNCFESRISEWAQILLEDMEEYVEKPLDPLHIINTAVCSLIFSIISGPFYGKHDPKMKEVREIVSSFTDCCSVAAILNVFPFLRHLPGDLFKFKKMFKMHNRFYEIMVSEIDMHKAKYQEDNPRDFIDAYGKLMEDSQGKAQMKGFKLSDDNLVYVCQDIIGGGTETMTTTLCWAVLLMMAYPEVQQKVQEELDDVLGRDHLPSWSDLPYLPYTEATIYEVMRFSPAAYLGIPHCSKVDVSIQGYSIPKDTLIIPNLWNVFRSPDSWKSPDKFDPLNFLAKDGSFQKPDEFIPFLTGRRMCPGEAIAKMELFLFFSYMMHRFTFHHPDGEVPDNIEGQANLTYKPPPFKTVLSLRY